MGVRRLFPEEGKIFQGDGGGGLKHTLSQKKAPKQTVFFQKVEKHTILAIQGGKSPFLPSPADAHGKAL